jgi:DnaJ-class molecular chaperone
MHEELEQDFEEEQTHVEPRPGPFNTDCAFCKGTGVHPASLKDISFVHCPSCHGTGMLEFKDSRISYTSCSQCAGSGREAGNGKIEPCHVCGGRGMV